MTTEIAVPYRIPLDQIRPSKTNPRKLFDPAKLEQLAESIRAIGVIEPVLVRPLNGAGSYELVAGERRFRASKLAECTSIPAIVQAMDDAMALEVQTIENLQRDDLHPLEEAAGYVALMKTAKYDVAKLGARIGRSAKYVYDRMKLLDLIPAAQKLFLERRMEAGHAILLARLKPEDQKRAIAIDDEGNDWRRTLFAPLAASLFDDEAFEKEVEKNPYAGVKAVSVREFQVWIQDNVKADPGHVDPFLFPETSVMVQNADEQDEKIVLITRDFRASDEVKKSAAGTRIHGERTWTRADGEEKSKTCDYSKLGFVACGPGQGEAFRVCTNKDKCTVHYGAEIRAREKRRRETAQGGDAGQKARERYADEDRKRKEQQARDQVDRARWAKARPAILEAIAAAVKKAPTKASGLLAKLVIDGLDSFAASSRDVEKLVPRGTSAEDVLRHAAMIVIASQGDPDGWRAKDELVPMAKAFDVDAGKIRDEVAPAETPKVQTAAKTGSADKNANSKKAARR